MIAVQIIDGVVVQALIATVEWATETYGGTWIQSDVPVWIGGTWDEVQGFQPPTS